MKFRVERDALSDAVAWTARSLPARPAVPVLGGVLDAAFVAKAEVGTWPVIRTVARLGRTVFVSRSRGATGKEAEPRD